jgi:hypothetical protein
MFTHRTKLAGENRNPKAKQSVIAFFKREVGIYRGKVVFFYSHVRFYEKLELHIIKTKRK